MNALRTNGKILDILKVLEYYQVIIGEPQFHLLFGLPPEPRGVHAEHSGQQILRDRARSQNIVQLNDTSPTPTNAFYSSEFPICSG